MSTAQADWDDQHRGKDAAERAAIVPSELSPDELWRRNGKYVPIELVQAARQDERRKVLEEARMIAQAGLLEPNRLPCCDRESLRISEELSALAKEVT